MTTYLRIVLLGALGMLALAPALAGYLMVSRYGLYAGAGTGKLLSLHYTLGTCATAAAVLKLKTFTCKVAGKWADDPVPLAPPASSPTL